MKTSRKERWNKYQSVGWISLKLSIREVTLSILGRDTACRELFPDSL